MQSFSFSLIKKLKTKIKYNFLQTFSNEDVQWRLIFLDVHFGTIKIHAFQYYYILGLCWHCICLNTFLCGVQQQDPVWLGLPRNELR